MTSMKFGETASVRVPFLTTCKAVCWYFSWPCSKNIISEIIRDHTIHWWPFQTGKDWERLGFPGLQRSYHRRKSRTSRSCLDTRFLRWPGRLPGRLQVLHPWPSETRHTFQPESKMFQAYLWQNVFWKVGIWDSQDVLWWKTCEARDLVLTALKKMSASPAQVMFHEGANTLWLLGTASRS